MMDDYRACAYNDSRQYHSLFKSGIHPLFAVKEVSPLSSSLDDKSESSLTIEHADKTYDS